MSSQMRSDGVPATPVATGAQSGQMSQQNLNQIVIEYLYKKGYSRTEAMLRVESAAQEAEGSAMSTGTRVAANKYTDAMPLLDTFSKEVLDLYKPELRRVLWPIFVYAFLRTLSEGYMDSAKDLFKKYKDQFEPEHVDDMRALELLSLPEHVKDSAIAQTYLTNKYRLSLSFPAYAQLVSRIEANLDHGGTGAIQIMTDNMDVKSVERVGSDTNAIEKILGRSGSDSNWPAEDEGIPGHNPGQNVGTASSNLTRLKLGPLPMEPVLFDDVLAELQEEDAKNPPVDGQPSLVSEFTSRIKQEESDDAPSRNDIPYPASKARDVEAEVIKIREHRDRFQLEAQKDKLSVCMYTFHNTHMTVNCIAISDDYLLIAIGTSEHYIRIFTMDGSPLKVLNANHKVASERLIGHSGPVFNLSFSPAVDSPERAAQAFGDRSKHPYMGTEFLLSCSEDRTIRLWHLGLMKQIMVYKAHLGPVFDVTWGPFGYYFLSAGHDKKAHLWSTAKASPLRWFVGHDQCVDYCCFHPNGAYCFTASSDKTVRMYSCVNGQCVRLFTGHTAYPTALACSPTGKVLASADESGMILLWDLAAGRLIKRMRGHEPGGIWSIDWNAEGSVLLSGGADGTVRLWDTNKTDGMGQGKIVGEGGMGTRIDGTGASAPAPAAAGGGGTAGGSKKKGKGPAVSGDQVSAFPTKQTPVKYVKFTRMNLGIGAGCYEG